MNISDEKLQEDIEKGLPEGHGADGNSYRIVFKALKKEPGFALSSSFADTVVHRIVDAKSQKAIRKDFIWMCVGFFILLLATGVSILITNFKFSPGAFTFLGNYGGLLLFGGAFITFLLWLERQILPKKPSQV